MAEQLPTTELSTTTEWGLGTSGPGVRPGFAQTEDNFPSPDELWPKYYDNVMRGRQDGPWYTGADYTIVDYSKTYVAPSSTGEVPPDITSTQIDGISYNGSGGDPIGGMRPTEGSPGEGNAFNYTLIPAYGGDVRGYGGNGGNGSVESPKAGSESQASCVDGTTRSPIYFAGHSGYSNPTGT